MPRFGGRCTSQISRFMKDRLGVDSASSLLHCGSSHLGGNLPFDVALPMPSTAGPETAPDALDPKIGAILQTNERRQVRAALPKTTQKGD